jgi:hypothetical protein
VLNPETLAVSISYKEASLVVMVKETLFTLGGLTTLAISTVCWTPLSNPDVENLINKYPEPLKVISQAVVLLMTTRAGLTRS